MSNTNKFPELLDLSLKPEALYLCVFDSLKFVHFILRGLYRFLLGDIICQGECEWGENGLSFWINIALIVILGQLFPKRGLVLS